MFGECDIKNGQEEWHHHDMRLVVASLQQLKALSKKTGFYTEVSSK